MSSDLSKNPAFRDVISQRIETCAAEESDLMSEVFEKSEKREKDLFMARDFFPMAVEEEVK